MYIGLNGMQILHSLSPSLYNSVRQAGQSITIMEICNEKGKVSSNSKKRRKEKKKQKRKHETTYLY